MRSSFQLAFCQALAQKACLTREVFNLPAARYRAEQMSGFGDSETDSPQGMDYQRGKKKPLNSESFKQSLPHVLRAVTAKRAQGLCQRFARVGGPGKRQVVVPVPQEGPEEWSGRRNVLEMPFIQPSDCFPAPMRHTGSLTGATSTENLPRSHLSNTVVGRGADFIEFPYFPWSGRALSAGSAQMGP